MKEVFVIRNIDSGNWFKRLGIDNVPLFTSDVDKAEGFTDYVGAQTILKQFDVKPRTRFCIEKHFVKQ